MIRPQVRALARRWREVIAAAILAAFGFWSMSGGGYVLLPLGIAMTSVAAGWGLIALRRVRFLRGVGAPGLVEVDEGQVGYFGPTFGGFVALADLSELRLAEHFGARAWRLKTADGQVLLIPVDAAGADRLYDAFAALPGIDMAALAAALDHGQPTLPLWTRRAARLSRM
jgi:hypothetical protein